MAELIYSKRAQRHLNGLIATEANTVKYIVSLLKDDANELKKLETERRAGTKRGKLVEGTRLVTRLNDRATFILHCFGLNATTTESSVFIDVL